MIPLTFVPQAIDHIASPTTKPGALPAEEHASSRPQANIRISW